MTFSHRKGRKAAAVHRKDAKIAKVRKEAENEQSCILGELSVFVEKEKKKQFTAKTQRPQS